MSADHSVQMQNAQTASVSQGEEAQMWAAQASPLTWKAVESAKATALSVQMDGILRNHPQQTIPLPPPPPKHARTSPDLQRQQSSDMVTPPGIKPFTSQLSAPQSVPLKKPPPTLPGGPPAGFMLSSPPLRSLVLVQFIISTQYFTSWNSLRLR